MEINSRVNYPVKAVLISMEEAYEIDMESATHKFCVSWFTLQVCRVGSKLIVEAWNNHPVPGRVKGSLLLNNYNFNIIILGGRHRIATNGALNDLMRSNNQAAQIDPQCIPPTVQAAREYQDAGETLHNSVGLEMIP